VTALSQFTSWLAAHQILLSIVLSLGLLVLVWRIDVVLSAYTRVSQRTAKDIRSFRPVATATVLVGALAWIIDQPMPGWLDDLSSEVGGKQIVDGVVAFLPGFIVTNRAPILITLLSVWWAWRLRATGDEIIERLVEKRYDKKLAPIVENVWDVTIIAIVSFIVLNQWGISATALLAPAGVISIIVGFSARETVSNFFGSISLYADETYTRGDFIELEDGVSGTVRDISVRSTVLQTLDGNLVTIPNSTLNNAKIENKSVPRPDWRISTRVGVSYDADPARVKALLTEAAADISDNREPMVHLRSFGDSALIFEVFAWAQAPEYKLTAEDDLNRAIFRALTDAGIEMPYPQHDVTLERESAELAGDGTGGGTEETAFEGTPAGDGSGETAPDGAGRGHPDSQDSA
jgi:small-conductance mechanosensitive channel